MVKRIVCSFCAEKFKSINELSYPFGIAACTNCGSTNLKIRDL